MYLAGGGFLLPLLHPLQEKQGLGEIWLSSLKSNVKVGQSFINDRVNTYEIRLKSGLNAAVQFEVVLCCQEDTSDSYLFAI